MLNLLETLANEPSKNAKLELLKGVPSVCSNRRKMVLIPA